MTHRFGLALVVISMIAVGLAYLLAFAAPGLTGSLGAWCMIFGIAGAVVGLMMLGASRDDRSLRPLLLPLAFTFAVLMLGFGMGLVLPAAGAAERLLFGLPLRAAIIVYGIGLLPILVLPFAYARTFDALTLSDEDLARVRAAAAQLKGTA
ncbi:MAG: hypothetical protein JWO05_2246 [Gemmatimonadetes bacterium]|nr:hypothetical protein [Gemmatimonadota bacterium]